MKTRLTKQEKTTDIWFDEKDTTIYIRTHNTDLKTMLKAYSRRFTSVCKLTDEDRETGCMEFEVMKSRFSFRLTAPYTEAAGGQQANMQKRMVFQEQGKIQWIYNLEGKDICCLWNENRRILFCQETFTDMCASAQESKTRTDS